jgi:SAM-dependent methyltransferase
MSLNLNLKTISKLISTDIIFQIFKLKNNKMNEIKPIAMPGTHESFFKYFKHQNINLSIKILDVGAGHGAFTKKLHDIGYDISACDLFPEIFKFEKIECKKVDITKSFPYADDTFDLIIAIEVSEHILDHEVFFRELSRILKPNGQIYLSTPNILSLKSRVRFLFNGFYYSFGPLDLKNHDGLQHVASLTLDQYNYIAVKYGFHKAEFEIDRKQSTSKWLFLLLYPFLYFNTKLKKRSTIHNRSKLLLGRLLFLNFKNNKNMQI